MPVLAYLFLVGFMTLQPGAELMMQASSGRSLLKKALTLIAFIFSILVADFDVVECGKRGMSSGYAGHVPFAFVRFSSSQLKRLGQGPVAELYTSDNGKVTHNPLKSWESIVSPGYGGYTQGNQFYGFAIDRDQLSSGSVKTQLKGGDCSGLRLEVHPRGNEYPRLMADLDCASITWEDAGNQNYYLHIDMREQRVYYDEGSRRGDVVRGRESAETSINMDSVNSGSGYGVYTQSGGGSRYSSSSSGSSTRSGVALAGGRQWAGAGSAWSGFRR